jgi:cytidylate kinase
VKIFLTASVEERAQRRYQEMNAKGYTVGLDTVKMGISNRDKIDSERAINPLRKADDAIVVDTTDKTVEDVVNEIINIIKER